MELDFSLKAIILCESHSNGLKIHSYKCVEGSLWDHRPLSRILPTWCLSNSSPWWKDFILLLLLNPVLSGGPHKVQTKNTSYNYVDAMSFQLIKDGKKWAWGVINQATSWLGLPFSRNEGVCFNPTLFNWDGREVFSFSHKWIGQIQKKRVITEAVIFCIVWPSIKGCFSKITKYKGLFWVFEKI